MNHRTRSLLSFSAFHFLDDGFTDSIYLLLPFMATELSLSFSQIGLLKGIFSGSTGLFQFPLSLLGERMGEFVGGAAGKFACGILAEWFGIIPMVVGTEILTITGILSLTLLPSSWVWFVLPLVGIVLNGTSSVLYATVAEMIPPISRSRGYGLYYAITLGSGALSPFAFGFLTDSMGLTFTITMTALMVFVTIPLSRYLSPKY